MKTRNFKMSRLTAISMVSLALLGAGSSAVTTQDSVASANVKPHTQRQAKNNNQTNKNNKNNQQNKNKNQSNNNQNNSNPNKTDIRLKGSRGIVILPHTVKAYDEKNANRVVMIPKGTRVAYKKVANGILVSNKKLQSGDNPNSKHELIVTPADANIITSKNNKPKTKPNAATKNPNKNQYFKSNKQSNKSYLPKTADHSMNIFGIFGIVAVCIAGIITVWHKSLFKLCKSFVKSNNK